MRAVVIRRYGAPEVFSVQDVPDPQPKTGEILIRVKSIGVNFADLLSRMGLYPTAPKPPFVPGLEVAGIVEKIGDGSRQADGDALRPGDAVTRSEERRVGKECRTRKTRYKQKKRWWRSNRRSLLRALPRLWKTALFARSR